MWGDPYKWTYLSGNCRWICEYKRLPSGDLVSFNIYVVTSRVQL